MKIKVETNNDEYSVSKCPYNKNIKLGGYWCSSFCRFFLDKDNDERVVSCGFDPIVEFSDSCVKIDTTNLVKDTPDEWRLKPRFKSQVKE